MSSTKGRGSKSVFERQTETKHNAKWKLSRLIEDVVSAVDLGMDSELVGVRHWVPQRSNSRR